MRKLSALLITLLTPSLFAVAPQFWRVRNVEDFLAGDIDGFAVTSRGDLRAGPSMRKVASFTDPFVLSQASGANGDRFFGTGNDGKVYRLRGTELKLLYTAGEPEIYALAYHDGGLYAASSPNGKVYRIDPNDGKGSVFYDPKQAYVWALAFAPNGELAAGRVLHDVEPGEAEFRQPEDIRAGILARGEKEHDLSVAGEGRRADGPRRPRRPVPAGCGTDPRRTPPLPPRRASRRAS